MTGPMVGFDSTSSGYNPSTQQPTPITFGLWGDSGSADGVIGLLDATSGATVATLFASGDKGVAYTPDGHFVTEADPRAVFQVVRGTEFVPMDGFVSSRQPVRRRGPAKREQAIGRPR